MSMNMRDKVRGMLLGVAIGDALGMPMEKNSPKEIEDLYGRVNRYLPAPERHPFKYRERGLRAGSTTDDTQLTLAVARALILSQGTLQMEEIAAQHVQAMRQSTVGWGPSTQESVERFADGTPWQIAGITSKSKRGLGNGVVMKISPIAAYFATQKGRQFEVWETRDFIQGFAYFSHPHSIAVATAMSHVAALRYLLTREPTHFRSKALIANAVYAIQLFDDQSNDIRGFRLDLGYLDRAPEDLTDTFIAERWPDTFRVSDTVPFCYAYFLRNHNSIDAVYDCIGGGGDTDSNAAIVGSMLGALHGTAIFPQHLIDGLQNAEEVLAVANQLCDSLGF